LRRQPHLFCKQSNVRTDQPYTSFGSFSGNKPFGSLTLNEIDQLYLLTSQIKTVRGGTIPAPGSPIESILANPGEERLHGATVEK
jgi:hypothetical protein